MRLRDAGVDAAMHMQFLHSILVLAEPHEPCNDDDDNDNDSSGCDVSFVLG